jgi:hypothetical protein
MKNINPNHIVELVKIANYFDDNKRYEESKEVTKVAQNILYHLNASNKEQIIDELVKEVR